MAREFSAAGKLEESLDDTLRRVNSEIEDLSRRVQMRSSSSPEEDLLLVFGPERQFTASDPCELDGKLERAYGVEILKLKLMMDKNMSAIEDIFDGKEIAPRAEQVALLNDELARCVEELDEFELYIKSCSDESRTEEQIEQDLFDEMKFIHAGLDLWKNRCIFEEGGSSALYEELASIKQRNGKLARPTRDTSNPIFPHEPGLQDSPYGDKELLLLENAGILIRDPADQSQFRIVDFF